jgi:hypothetical protein
MGTAVLEGQLVLKVPVELLGPGSEYERRWLALKKDIQQLVLDSSKIKQVTSPEELESANNAGRVLQASTREVELFYKPLKQQVDAFKAPLLLHEKEFAGPVAAAWGPHHWVQPIGTAQAAGVGAHRPRGSRSSGP